MTPSKQAIANALDKFAVTTGVVACCAGILERREADWKAEAVIFRAGDPDAWPQAEQWAGVLRAAVEMWCVVANSLKHGFVSEHEAGDDVLRVVIGAQAVVVKRVGRSVVVAVVIPGGHPVSKSLRRLLRRSFRKMVEADDRPAMEAP